MNNLPQQEDAGRFGEHLAGRVGQINGTLDSVAETKLLSQTDGQATIGKRAAVGPESFY